MPANAPRAAHIPEYPGARKGEGQKTNTPSKGTIEFTQCSIWIVYAANIVYIR